MIVRWLAIALAGAIICTICDHQHVVTGVLSYPKPAFWQEAWWVPLLFAGAGVVIVAGAKMTRKMFGAPPLPRPSAREIVGLGVAFVAAYFYTAYGHAQPTLVLWVLFAFWVGRLLPSAPPWLVVYSALTAIGGTLFESGWSALGFFHYEVPDVIGVPRWLPCVYLHAAPLTAALESFVTAEEPAPAPSSSAS